MNKAFRILEIIWLAMGCVGVILCAYNIVSGNTRDVIFFLVFTFACGLMYAVRRKQRLKFESSEKNNDQKK